MSGKLSSLQDYVNARRAAQKSTTSSSGIQIQKEAIVREYKEMKLRILREKAARREEDKLKHVMDHEAVADIRRKVDDNQLAIMKLLQANEILTEAAAHHIEEISKEFDEKNPFLEKEELEKMERDQSVQGMWTGHSVWTEQQVPQFDQYGNPIYNGATGLNGYNSQPPTITSSSVIPGNMPGLMKRRK